MKIEWNRVTWYSRVATFVVFLVVLPAVAFYIFVQYDKVFNFSNSQVEIINY